MVVDLVLIGVILLFTFLGYYRGLIKVGIKILGFVISLVIALILYTPISNYIIENTNIATELEGIIQERLYQQDQSEENQELTNNIIENFGKYTDDIKSNSSEYIAENLSIMVVRIGTWIGLFLIARVLMIFLRIFGSMVEKIPIIKQFNKVGGTIYGVLEGIVIAYIGLAIISFISPMMKSTQIIDTINDSYVCKSMYDNNIILKMIL